MEKYRLGLTMGSGYIAWCILLLDDKHSPSSILDGGVRLYSDGRDPQTNESLAVNRRICRAARIMRMRFKRRRACLVKYLVRFGLWPKNKEASNDIFNNTDIYRLRYEALDRKLSPYELGRVLLALNAKRGFKSNRLIQDDDEEIDNEDNLSYLVISSNARTLGEYFWLNKAHVKRDNCPVEHWSESPLQKQGLENKTNRKLYEDEFDYIMRRQAQYHNLSDAQCAKLRSIIFFQRPLKPQEKGRCQLYFEKNLSRASAALPSAQSMSALEAVGKLRIVGSDRKITKSERDKIYELLCGQKTVTFKKIRSLLGLEDHEDLRTGDLDSDRINGVSSSAILSSKKYFGDAWHILPYDQQDDIVKVIMEAESSDVIIEKIKKYGLTEEQLDNVSKIKPSVFKYGESRFSEKAIRDILALMLDGMSVEQAVDKLSGNVKSDKLLDKLKYYGFLIPEVVAHRGTRRKDLEERQSGIIANPTHHIGLNQLRKVVNSIIEEYGHPTEISMEISRELKMSAKNKKNFNKNKKEREARNKEIYLKLKNLHSEGYEIDYKRDFEKYDLWDELGDIKKCPLTGKTISLSAIFTEDVVVEHILPLDLTLDDTMSNKMICFREAALYKGERAPYEAFGKSLDGYNYNNILKNTSKLPPNKSWRFEPDAMELFATKDKLIEHQLNDTRYLSRITAKYLRYICNDVRVSPGRLTSKLRKEWGLNGIFNEFINKKVVDNSMDEEEPLKNNEDHRFNIIDAIAVSMTDKELLEKSIQAIKVNKLKKLTFSCPLDIAVMHNQVRELLSSVVISHRKEHNRFGQLKDGTNYGLANTEEKSLGFDLVTTKKLTDLTSLNHLYCVRDPFLKQKLYDLVADLDPESQDFKNQLYCVLSEFSEKSGIKRVRILVRNAGEKYTITKHGRYKVVLPSDIHHVQFWEMPDGSVSGVGLSRFFLRYHLKSKKDNRPHPAAKIIMKLHKGDMIELDHKGKRVKGIVLSLRPSNKVITWTEHTSAKKKPKHESFVFNKLIKNNVKKININVIGKLQNAR